MKRIYIVLSSLVLMLSLGFGSSSLKGFANIPAQSVYSVSQISEYSIVNPLSVVANPGQYLNKKIKMRAKFDKYSTLGLDYPPAMRSHEKYISFLIQRPDVVSHNIPLSEFKIFIKKEIAEKNIDLNAGDEIEFSGVVFSNALGDAWMDADNFIVINKVKKAK